VRPNKKIDTTLSSVLFTLLGQPEGEPISLATRNLLRNLTMKVPSGQRVAQAMNLPELSAGDLDDLQPLHLHQRTPLWFYVLREAAVTAGGEHLGPADQGRSPVLSAPGPRLDPHLWDRRLLHHGGPAHHRRRRRHHPLATASGHMVNGQRNKQIKLYGPLSWG
jgi:hypothetical protein